MCMILQMSLYFLSFLLNTPLPQWVRKEEKLVGQCFLHKYLIKAHCKLFSHDMPSPENIVTISHNNVFPFLLHSSLKHRIALRSYTLQKPCTYTDNTFQRRRKKSIFVVFIRLCNNALFLLKVIHLFCLYCTLAFCYSGNRHVSE